MVFSAQIQASYQGYSWKELPVNIVACGVELIVTNGANTLDVVEFILSDTNLYINLYHAKV